MAAAETSPPHDAGRISDVDHVTRFLLAATDLYRAAVMMHLSVDDADVTAQHHAVARLASLSRDEEVITSLHIPTGDSSDKIVADTSQVGQSLALRLDLLSRAADAAADGGNLDAFKAAWPASDVVILRQALDGILKVTAANDLLSPYVLIVAVAILLDADQQRLTGRMKIDAVRI